MDDTIFAYLRIGVFAGIFCIGQSAQAGEADEKTVPVLSRTQVVAYWETEQKVAPKYPSKALYRSIQGCATVGYVIEPDGTTNLHRVLVNHPSAIFDAASIEAARQFTYHPTEENTARAAVFTSNTFTYQITQRGDKDPDAEMKKLAAICNDAADQALMTFSEEIPE